MDLIPVLATGTSILIFLSVIELIRRNRLREKYSLLWLFSSFVIIVFSVSRDLLHYAASLVGIQYPPALIFLFGLLFIIVINVHITSVLSQLSEQNKRLSQELALLKNVVELELAKEE